MTRAIDQSAKFSLALVQFKYGNPAAPTFKRYTDAQQDFNAFISQPDMKVTLPPNTATFGGAEAKIELPLNEFTTPVAMQAAFSPIAVSIIEYIRPLEGGPSATQLTLFKGKAQYVVKSAQGRRDTVVLRFTGIKSRLNVKLGLPGNHHCVWNLFAGGCGVLEALYRKTCEIATISGRVVTLSTPNVAVLTPTSPGGNVDRFWERGYFEFDGLKISINKWEATTPNLFYLKKPPPPTWLLTGAGTIKIVPGCHKTIEDCRATWDAEQFFMGFGYACPSYNPTFETGNK